MKIKLFNILLSVAKHIHALSVMDLITITNCMTRMFMSVYNVPVYELNQIRLCFRVVLNKINVFKSTINRAREATLEIKWVTRHTITFIILFSISAIIAPTLAVLFGLNMIFFMKCNIDWNNFNVCLFCFFLYNHNLHLKNYVFFN